MNLRKSLLRGFAPAVTALALAAMVSTSANAASITIAPTGNNSYELSGGNTLTNFTNTNNGYNFALYTAASAVNTGSNQGLVMDGATTTNGASVLALDGDYEQGAVTTTLSNLVAGDVVTLTFDFAGSQQLTASDGCQTCQGDFDALLGVTLNGAVLTSGETAANSTGGLLNSALGATEDKVTGSACTAATSSSTCISSQGFSGWEAETLTFTVGSGGSNSLLSFLASSTDSNQVPAFALVDNLSYTVTPPPAPEPNSLILLGTGLAGLGGLVRSRFTKATIKA